MPVTSREILPPPDPPPPLKLMIFVITLLLLGLFGFSIVAGGLTSVAPVVERATAMATLPPLAITPPAGVPEQPTTPPLAELAARLNPAPVPTVAELPAGCPPVEPLPDGVRVGWRGRAAGCADVLYASVDGDGRWVRRPDGFPQALYEQLPELPAR